MSQRTTTSPPAKPPLFESPEQLVDEELTLAILNQPLNVDTFNPLINAACHTILAAFDRRCTREIFQDIVVTACNFQNRAVRYAELSCMLGNLSEGKGFGTTEIKAERERQLGLLAPHQKKLVSILELFQEMRDPGDPVS